MLMLDMNFKGRENLTKVHGGNFEIATLPAFTLVGPLSSSMH